MSESCSLLSTNGKLNEFYKFSCKTGKVQIIICRAIELQAMQINNVIEHSLISHSVNY